MLRAVCRISESGPYLEDDCSAVRARIEDIRRELELLMHKAHKETALHVQPCLEGLGALHHRAELEPVDWRDGELWPRVIEISRLRSSVEDVLVVEGELEYLP